MPDEGLYFLTCKFSSYNLCIHTHSEYLCILANSKHCSHYFYRIEKQEEEEEMCDVEEQIVGGMCQSWGRGD